MIRLTLRAILARPRRTALTVLVIVAGVATISGTLVFTDTLRASFQRAFLGGARGAQVVVASRRSLAGDPSLGAAVPDALLPRIRALPGVKAAQGQIAEPVTIARGSGVLATGRVPAQALSLLSPPFRGLRILAGAAPQGSTQVALDPATASRDDLRVGERLTIETDQPARTFTISGLAELGPAGGAVEPYVVLPLATARKLYDSPHTVDRVEVAAATGVSVRTLRREISPLLPSGLVARDAHQQADVEAEQLDARFASLDAGLLAFALVAVLVGFLLVFNTFSITATQRAAELALLRALGATRAGVLRSVLLEALLVGVVGTAVGLALGPPAALLIRELFVLGGVTLPSGGLALRADVGIVGGAVGVGGVLLAALLPGMRAMRTAPLEALRVARAQRSGARLAAARAVAASILVAAGLAVILTAGGDTAERLRQGAVGAAILVAAAIAAGPLIVCALARPVLWPVARRQGVVARLAREEALRSPGRTAVSASSLTIGLALVLLVTIYAGALRSATGAAIRHTFVGDIAVQSADGTTPIPAAAVQATATAAARVPDIAGIASLQTAQARLARAGTTVQVDGVQPSAWSLVYRFAWVAPPAGGVEGLAPGQVLVEQDTARAAGLSVGQRMSLRTGSGRRVSGTVAGIYRDAGLLRGVTIDSGWFGDLFRQPRLQDLFVKLLPGASPRVALATLRRPLRAFPGLVTRSQRGLARRAERDVTSLVGLLYALLVLSVLTALAGIAGSLSLSVHGRASEIGTLRAIGMSPRQARALIRDESMVTAVVGGVSGVLLGLLLGWGLTRALSFEGFSFAVPWGAVGVVALVSLGSGLLAALTPGHRAGRLDVLAAVASE